MARLRMESQLAVPGDGGRYVPQGDACGKL